MYTPVHNTAHTHMHSYTHALIHTCTHTHMHSYTHALIHTCTHTHMHSYTCAHAHVHATCSTCCHAHFVLQVVCTTPLLHIQYGYSQSNVPLPPTPSLNKSTQPCSLLCLTFDLRPSCRNTSRVPKCGLNMWPNISM